MTVKRVEKTLTDFVLKVIIFHSIVLLLITNVKILSKTILYIKNSVHASLYKVSGTVNYFSIYIALLLTYIFIFISFKHSLRKPVQISL